jgi:tight adherence protein C
MTNLQAVVALGVIVGLAASSAAVLIEEPDPAIRRRLRAISAAGRTVHPGAGGWSRRLATFVLTLAPAALKGQKLRDRLAGAGLTGERAVARMLCLQFATGSGIALVVGALAVAAGDPGSLVLGLLGGLVGFHLPSVWLRRRSDRRLAEIRIGLPDCLDLMVVCVEAGLGLSAALIRVARELRSICPALSQELGRLNQEIRAGTARADALRALRERVPLEDVESLVAMLIQTDRMGTSVANALRVHSDTLRTKRRQRAEARARQATVKLIVPLVVFIFPGLLVILLGPAMLSIAEVLGGVTGR